MNEKFFTLSPEKQARITNAAPEVFARNDYKHASTDDIAAKAGISKGLLFYYFRNKQSLYLYLYDYEAYQADQGLNIDLWAELPGAAFRDAEALAQAVEERDYDRVALAAYRDKYIETGDRNNTEEVAAFLLDQMPSRLRREREPAEV